MSTEGPIYELKSFGMNETVETPRASASQDTPTIVVSTDDGLNPKDRNIALQLTSCCISFFCAGVDGGSLGTLIPYFRHFYGIGFGTLTVVYATSFVGWCLAGATNGPLIRYFNLGTMLLLGASIQLLAQVFRCWDPPFSVFCIGFTLSALGTGYQDSHANSFVSTIRGSHRWLGLIHALYSLGMTVSPFVANSIAKKGAPSRSEWSRFYLFPLGLNALNVGLVAYAFRSYLWPRGSPTTFNDEPSTSTTGVTQPTAGTTRIMQTLLDFWQPMTRRGVWQLSLWFFFYLGAGVTQVSWLVEYLVTVRHGNLAKMGFVPAGNSGAGFIGRLVMPEVCQRLGERRAVVGLLVIWIALQVIFLAVPNLTVDIVVVSINGFFTAPLFATGINVAAKLYSKQEQPAVLGLVFIAAQAGGALFPTITGLVADAAGVRVLQPIVIALVVAALCAWLLIPKPARRED